MSYLMQICSMVEFLQIFGVACICDIYVMDFKFDNLKCNFYQVLCTVFQIVKGGLIKQDAI